MNRIKYFNSNKKIVILLILIIGVLSTYIGDLYGIFKKQNYLANINIDTTELNYKIENEELQNNTIKVSANSERTLTLFLTSLNNIDSKYELYYLINGEISDNNDIEIGYIKESIDTVKGVIKPDEKKRITISIKNKSKKTASITFECEGALVDKEIEITKGKNIKYEIINDGVIFAYNLDGPSGLYPDKFPGKNDGYIVTGVTCNGADAVWDNENWNVTISSLNSKTISCNVGLKHSGIWDFPFINDYKKFVALGDGVYKIELWGASGGDIESYIGGNGSYTSGNIYLNKGTELYVYVGGGATTTSYLGGYNGGGDISEGQLSLGRAGGGATDIRVSDGQWSEFNSLKSRIMVAAGGGGANKRGEGFGEGNGGSGGGLVGQSGVSVNNWNGYGYAYGTGGNQCTGGEYIHIGGTCSIENGCITLEVLKSGQGKFGFGGSALWSNGFSQTSGGSGYYGGGQGGHGGAGGGSSFISGHNGCDAINETSTGDNIIHTGQPNHYSGYVFTDTVMIDGDGYNWTTEKGEFVGMPSYIDGSIIAGNDGNGYARITYISE